MKHHTSAHHYEMNAFQRILAAILIVMGCGFQLSVATEYLVSSPADISSIMPTAQPGDTLTMTTGIWQDAAIVFSGNGTESRPILLRARIPGQVLLSGRSNLRIAGTYLVVDGLYFANGYSPSGAVVEFRGPGVSGSSYCRLTNTAIIGFNPSSINTDYKWISLYGTHNRVDHCFVKGKSHSGTTLVVWLDGNPNYHLIDHNYFGYRPELGFNGGETIRIGTSDYSMSDSYTTVEYNYFEQCNGEIEIISNKSCENIYRYNTFYNCEGTLTLRHGNRCTVEGNFFFGNKNDRSGGVRIIGEDHTVYNNYFQDLNGNDLRAAISIMNGVPNSPLNRYFQVKNAQVLFNTIVNCYEPLDIGAGADDEKTLAPENCIIADNLVKSDNSHAMIVQDSDPVNLTWEGNIMYGAPLGITQPDGISITDPLLAQADDDLWRPAPQSPVIGAATGDFPFVTDDMDGQQRTGAKDVGADQYSTDPVVRTPVSALNTGPYWYPPVRIVHQVTAGPDSLQIALMSALPGEILELTTDGGDYSVSSNLAITFPITIRATEGLTKMPVIRQTNPSTGTRIIFEIKDGGSLTLSGLELDGMKDSDTPAKYLIRTDDQPMTKHYLLRLDSCYLHDVAVGDDGNFFRAYAGTYADSIVFSNCIFENSGKEGIRLKDEASGSGIYDVGYFELNNCTFWKTRKEALTIYAGDDNPFSPGPVIRVDHCTFDSCGYDSSSIIYALEADYTNITNSIFSNSPANEESIRLDGWAATVSFCDTFRVGPIGLNRGAKIGAGMLGEDPLYADTGNGDFTLTDKSPLWYKGDDGKALGDLRWAKNPPVSIEKPGATHIVDSFDLLQNYPNPFNPETTIRYSLNRPGTVTIRVYDVKGALVETLADGRKAPGEYTLSWTPERQASGVYFCNLTVDGNSKIIKMMFLK